MLNRLIIKNYILIEDGDIAFSPHFNVITGETGAGKSIVIGALKILLGNRPEGTIIKSGADKSVIEGEFNLSNPSLINILNNDFGCEIEDGNLYIKRIFTKDGKNKCFLNGSPSPVSIIRKIGNLIVNFYGQHDFLLLFDKNYQLDLLDKYAASGNLLKEYRTILSEYNQTIEQIDNIKVKAATFKEKEDLYNYQLDELQTAELKIGEEEELQKELNIVENVEQINALSYDLLEVIYNSDNSILNNIAYVTKKIENLKKMDGNTEVLSNLMGEAQINIEEVSQFLKDYTGNLEYDPGNVDFLRSRLETIYKLKNKYNKSVEKLIEFKDELDLKLSLVREGNFDIDKLTEILGKLRDKLLKSGKKLSTRRKKHAELLEREINSRLDDVGLKGASFAINIIPNIENNDVFSLKGFEIIEILLRSNPGENFKPLAQIASGGEISRLMLVLKSIIVENTEDLLMVFDEIDVGISGKVAQQIGEKVKSIAKNNQVISITHLPQVASYGDNHLAVRKNQSDTTTIIFIEKLDEKGKTEEIASLLRGKEKSEASYKHAEELIKNSR